VQIVIRGSLGLKRLHTFQGRARVEGYPFRPQAQGLSSEIPAAGSGRIGCRIAVADVPLLPTRRPSSRIMHPKGDCPSSSEIRLDDRCAHSAPAQRGHCDDRQVSTGNSTAFRRINQQQVARSTIAKIASHLRQGRFCVRKAQGRDEHTALSCLGSGRALRLHARPRHAQHR
jgi:hypothetical protein